MILTLCYNAMMATAEIDIRLLLDQALHERAEQAAILLGIGSVAEYALWLVEKDTAKLTLPHDELRPEYDLSDLTLVGRGLYAERYDHTSNKKVER